MISFHKFQFVILIDVTFLFSHSKAIIVTYKKSDEKVSFFAEKKTKKTLQKLHVNAHNQLGGLSGILKHLKKT